MQELLKRSWAVVDLDAVVHNLRTLRKLIPDGCKMMVPVKADAYGHGDGYVARALAEAGANWFGVSNLEEAISLRNQGVYQPILIFGYTSPSCAEDISRYGVTQTVYSLEFAQDLHRAASQAGVTISVHIKLDTGMSRLGFSADNNPERAASELRQVHAMDRFYIEGIYTHLAVADEDSQESREFTREQHQCFCRMVERLEEMGFRYSIKHCCNSAGVICWPDLHMDMVRPGIAIYGFNPGEISAGKVELRPAMSLYSTVTLVKEVPPGATVSYGREFTATGPTKVASVAMGYGDGYQRVLGGRARTLVQGEYAPVIGRVCMDQMMLDVTHIPGVKQGDVVTIVGTDGDNTLTFDEMAELTDSITYEKVCTIGRRVPRVYRKNGVELGIADYLKSNIPKV